MKTTSEYLILLKQFKDSRALAYGIRKIGLFGSVARGEHTEDSDVDVVYEGEPNILLRSRMKQELEVLFDCRVVWSASVDSWEIIYSEKLLIKIIFGYETSKDYKYDIDSY